MKQAGTGEPDKNSAFRQAAEQSFGSYDPWRADFVGIGKMRGVGWAICYQDPTNGRLSNHWITLHQIGNVAGFTCAGDGCVGARISPRLQARGAAEVHRSFLFEHRLACGGKTSPEKCGGRTSLIGHYYNRRIGFSGVQNCSLSPRCGLTLFWKTDVRSPSTTRYFRGVRHEANTTVAQPRPEPLA